MHAFNLSRVAQVWGAGVGTNVQGATRFIETCVPRQWKPKVLSGGLWNDFQRRNYGVIQHGVGLDDFPHWIEDPKDINRMRAIWGSVEEDLRHELDKIPGVTIQHDETRTTDCAPHLWQWSFVYEIEPFSGMFTIWISPLGNRKALMIAELIEFSVRETTAK